jgi:hypothetical protein
VRRALAALALAVLVGSGCSGDDLAPDELTEPTATTEALLAGEPLEDGTHFGLVVALDRGAFRLVFDPAELLEGDEALAAAEADGTVVTQGGHYVRNPDEQLHPLTLSPDVVVRLLVPCCDLHDVPFAQWYDGFEADARSFYGTRSSRYEVTLDHGKVVKVDEVLVD